jgi:membrane fusion protein (multidrug efflux system)
MIKKNIKQNSLIAGIVLVCVITFAYWLYNQFYVSTDDAYVNANVVQIAPRVTGQVQHLYIVNNQYVKEGQLLFDLDPAIFQVTVDQMKAHVDISEANLKLAQLTALRTTELLQKRVTSTQENDNKHAALISAIANLQLAKSNLMQAELNLSYTKIYASTSGWATNVSLRVGSIASANQPQFALVSDKEFWIDANFKETEFARLTPGEKADIKVDMYPKYSFKGVVESISSGSGTAFSLLPPENATGNWVKVTQRVPVRIRILNPNPKYPLRIGTTATVSIRV